jgi:hypothetical protein
MKTRRRVNMDFEKAINVAIGCVMASHMENKEKREVIETLRGLEEYLEKIQAAGWINDEE